MENYRWVRPYRAWMQERYDAFNVNKKREAREAMKLINSAFFPYPGTANKTRVALAVQYLNRNVNIHMLRQQINKRGKLMRISPPTSPNKKKNTTRAIPIKRTTRK